MKSYRHYVDNYILNPTHQLSVVVVGCGGTGSQVLTSLGRMNYALQQLGHPGLHVIAYDADIVTEANCGRQLFSPIEVGRNKAEVLVTKLNMFFGTKWESRSEMFTEHSGNGNIIVSCVDNVASRLAIKKGLKKRGYDYEKCYYWLDFGNAQKTGQVILGTSENVAEHSGPSCSLAEALTKQDLFINSTLAQIGMALLWRMFTNGVLEYRGAYLNLVTMKVNPIRIQKT